MKYIIICGRIQRLNDCYHPIAQAFGQPQDNVQSRYNAVPMWGEMGIIGTDSHPTHSQRVTITHTEILGGNRLRRQGIMVLVWSG